MVFGFCMRSESPVSVKRWLRCMTVQDGVGDGGVADPRMPVLDRQLAGDDGGLVAGTVIDDLKQIGARHAVDGAHAPIVQHEHVSLRELQ